MEDWLKKWYNDQFNKIDLSPSSKVWDNISVSMEDWPKHWYKSNTNQLKTEPRPSTWQSIHSQLADINYPARSVRPAYIMIAIVIFIMSLIPTSLSDGKMDLTNRKDSFSINYKTDNSIKEYNLSLNEVNDNYYKATDKQMTNSILDEVSKKNDRNDRLDNKKLVIIPTSKELNLSLSPRPTPVIQREASNRLITADSLTKNNFDIANLPQRRLNYPEINLRDDLVFQPNHSSYPDYSIGLHFVPQFSSLLNPLRTKIRANKDIEILNPVSVGFDLSFEKYITSKNSLRVSVRGNNIKSLEFKEHNTLKEMTLNYASLDLTYNRNWRLGNSDKLYLKTYIGIFAGYAISKGVNYNGDRVAYIEDGLNNIDFGNSMGVILSRRISDNTRLEIGVNSQFGAMNIFKGTNVLPSKYFRISTISYGLNFGLIREF